MYLKSLVLHGFKSFAQRVEILFSPGVSAIVGPNGSGKSNISDAIRWVLGEQSVRQLRGSALQDVIFAGTDQRRPLGMAAVSLTLDNSDGELDLPYAEVTVTRRVYRSGESEFFINGTACRLRDIHELFMDTGLGRGSMAIIGQGEVDAILSARPEERRALIEEVAGITRYRTRRKEAMQRLEQTEQDLVRLYDIIAEVERNLAPLEREAEKASRYREWSARLREIEIALLYQQWAKHKRAWHARRQDVLAAERSIESLRLELAQAQQESRKTEQALQNERHRLANWQEEAQRIEKTLHELRTQTEVLDERIVGLEQQRVRHQAEKQRLKHQQAEVAERLKKMQEERLAAASFAEESNDLLQQAVSRLAAVRKQISDVETALQAARQQVVERVQAAADVRSQTEQARIAHAAAAELASRLERELEAARSEYADLAEQMEQLEKRRSDLNDRKQALEAERSALQSKREKQRSSLAALRAELDQLQSQLARIRSRREALAELESSFEGFHESVRACLRADEPWRANVYGAVGSLLRVPTEYETALETALGSAMQNVVVADQRTAEQAIDFLKRTKAGRVTFLPLNALRTPAPLHVPPEVRNDPEFIGVGADLVEAPAHLDQVVQFLLARVLVTRTLRGAVRLMQQVKHFARAVSLEGDLVLASGPITGGYRAAQRSTGVLSRSHRIHLLDAEMQESQQALSQLAAQYEAVVASSREADAALEKIQADYSRIQEEAIALQRRCDVLQERMAAARRALQRAEEEQKRAIQQQQEAEAALRIAAEKLAETDSDQSRLHLDVQKLEQQLLEYRTESERWETLRAERHTAWLQAEAERNRLEQEIRQCDRTLSEMEASLQRVEDEIKALDGRHQAAVQQRESVAASMREAEQYCQRLQEQRHGIDRTIAEMLAALEASKEAEAICREKLEQATHAVHRAQLALEKEGFALEQIEANLAAFQAAIPQSPDEVAVEADKDFAAEAKRLRERLDQLGHVNLNALDEYAAQQERHRFLLSQKEDLLQAKRDLEKTISDFDATSRTRLQDSLRRIQAALDEVFPRLFGGGSAKLTWTDPDDPLESGIDIIVQPKSKRPQPLLTLSGGERSLAAIALLFAIMKVRPSPFFVLDEIDAALDERNVERFADLLREFGERNQIIVITHRQATMEAADTLFGVTMERHGASQLVSLQLDDAVV